MSFYLQIDGENDDQIATNTGWGDYGRWAKTLDPGKFREVRDLYELGWSDEPESLIAELKDAADEFSPDADVLSIVNTILELLDDAKDATVVSVTDGMGEDEASELSLGSDTESRDRKKRDRFLLSLLAFFAWQGEQYIEGSGTVDAASSQERLAGVLARGMQPLAIQMAGRAGDGRGVLPAGVEATIDKYLATESGRLATLINATTDKAVKKAFGKPAPVEGEAPAVELLPPEPTEEEVKAMVDEVIETTATRAQAIEDDANHLGGQIGMQSRAEVDQKWLQWHTEEDDKVCDICEPLDGIVFRAGSEVAPGIRWPVIDTHTACRDYVTEYDN